MPPKARSGNGRSRQLTRIDRSSAPMAARMVLNRGVFITPDKILVQLPYTQAARSNPGVVAFLDQIWNLNSVNDPDRSGGGHQARGIDQWQALYGRYRVRTVEVEISYHQRALGTVAFLMVPSNDPTALAAGDQPSELARAVVGALATGGGPCPVHRFKIAPAAVLGLTEAQYDADDRQAAAIGADPTETVVLHQCMANSDNVTVLDCDWRMRLIYTVELFDRTQVPVS